MCWIRLLGCRNPKYQTCILTCWQSNCEWITMMVRKIQLADGKLGMIYVALRLRSLPTHASRLGFVVGIWMYISAGCCWIATGGCGRWEIQGNAWLCSRWLHGWFWRDTHSIRGLYPGERRTDGSWQILLIGKAVSCSSSPVDRVGLSWDSLRSTAPH